MLKTWIAQINSKKTNQAAKNSKNLDESALAAQGFLSEAQDALNKFDDIREGGSHWLETAETAFQRSLEFQPGSAEALSGLSHTSFLMGRYTAAQRQAQQAVIAASSIGKERSYAEASTVLGHIKLRRGEFSEARIAFYQALYWDTFSKKSSAYTGWGMAQWALARGENTSFFNFCLSAPKAITAILVGQSLKKLSALHSTQTFDALNIAVTMFKAKALNEVASHKQAQQLLFDLSEKFPGHDRIALNLAASYRSEKDFLMANFWYQKVLNRHPGHLRALSGLLEIAQYQEDTERAIFLSEELIRWRPSNAQAWEHLASSLTQAQLYPRAIESYKRALHLTRDNEWKAIIAMNLGQIYLNGLSDLNTAQAYFEMARMLNPRDVDNYKELGELYYHSEAFDNAELLNRQAIQLDPDDANLHAKLGYLYKSNGRMEEAMASYRQATVLDSQYTLPLHNLGTLHLDHLGEPEQAIELFKQVLEINPDDAVAAYNLGRAYSLHGQRIEAARCFQQAQELNDKAEKMHFDRKYLNQCLAELFE
jgi:tetratricopeptide (TPR) repeat protein